MPLKFHDVLGSNDILTLRKLVTATNFFTPQEIDVAVELMEDRVAKGFNSEYEFLLAENMGNIIGYSCYGRITMTEATYDLYWIVVAPKAQGKGLGQQLMSETESRIRKAGGRKLIAETSSQPKYSPTHKFYDRCQFMKEAIIRDYYRQGDHKLIFSKVL